MDADFEKADGIDLVVNVILGTIPKNNYVEAHLFNNAGSLGQLSKIREQTYERVQSNISVNLTAPIILTSKFIARFGHVGCKMGIVNVSSLAAYSLFNKVGFSHLKHGECIAP